MEKEGDRWDMLVEIVMHKVDRGKNYYSLKDSKGAEVESGKFFEEKMIHPNDGSGT